MSVKKEAHLTVTAAGQASENKGVTAFSPLYNSIIDTDMGQGRVEAVLPHGSENAISAAHLVAILGIKNSRVLRLMVNKEREHGALILTSDRGYFMPAHGIVGQQEIWDFVSRMEAAAWNTHKATRAARNALQSVEGQVTLPKFYNERGC